MNKTIIFISSFDPINNKIVDLALKNKKNDLIFLILPSSNCDLKYRKEMINISFKCKIDNYKIIDKYSNIKERKIVVSKLIKDLNIKDLNNTYLALNDNQLILINDINDVIINENSGISYNFRCLQDLNNIDIDILRYITKNSLYYIPKIKLFLTEKRYNHSVSVADLSYEIAVSNKKKDPNKYYFAGLLHDIGKYIKEDEVKRIMESYYPMYLEYDKPILHQFVGEYLCKTIFNIYDSEILEAIKYHTTGNSNMHDLGKCLLAADDIEPLRGYDSSDMISACLKDLEKGFRYVLDENRKFWLEKGNLIENPLSEKAHKQYLK